MFKVAIIKFPRFNKIVLGEKIILVHEGAILTIGMQKAMMNNEELFAVIREHGINDIQKVDLAIL